MLSDGRSLPDRGWAMRPGPAVTYLKMLVSDAHTFKLALRVGVEHAGWVWGTGTER
jgi:hypothetical protein